MVVNSISSPDLPKEPAMAFRLEINGLRALAVGLVILFHFRVPYFTGGFIGVDGFFVISGFLMTQIILGRLEAGNFSVVLFYLDRMKRIIPALVVMVGVLLFVCWFLVEPGTFEETGRRSAAAVLFVSNILFTFEAGYFAQASESNLLLHTWSLSAEWQFYMVYPIFLALIFRLGRKEYLIGALSGLAAFSFGISLYMIARGGRWPDGAYFLLPSRAWEMLLGGLVYIADRRVGSVLTLIQRRVLEFAGVGAIIASALSCNIFTPWPSLPALVPTFGSALIILANCQKSSILRFRPLQSIGRWSYSIYLWHWPILGLLHYFELAQSGILLSVGVGLSVVIGSLSYHFVEKRAPKANTWRSAIILLAAPSAVAVAGFLIVLNDGFAARSKGNIDLVYDSLEAPKDWNFPRRCAYLAVGRPDCTIGNGTGGGRIAIFGDSHAEMLYPRLLSTSSADLLIEFVTSAGCPPIPRLDHLSWGTRCSRYHADAVKYLKTTPFDRIVYASIWTTYFDPAIGMCVRTDETCTPITANTDISAIFEYMYKEIAEFTKLGRQVYIVLPFPIPYTDLPKEIRKREFGSRNSKAINFEMHPLIEERIRSYLEKAAAFGAIIIDPRPYMCANGTCNFTDQDGHSLFTDGSHLRASTIATTKFNFLDVLTDSKGMDTRRTNHPQKF